MIVYKEELTISRDDPLFPETEKKLTEELGWKKKEYTAVVVFKKTTIHERGENAKAHQVRKTDDC